MFQNFVKRFVLWSISNGLRLPQASIDRVSELIFLKSLIDQLGIDCVLDVGGNRGQFSEELRKIGYAGQIISFEPIGSEFLAMQEKFRNDSKWRGFQMALGAVEESKPILVTKLTVMSSLLEPIVLEKDARKEMVEVRRLDDLFASVLKDFSGCRIFLKMDTQGYDLEVFKGALGCLRNIFGIQSEISIQPLYKNMPHYVDALKTYESAGFELYNLSVVNRISTGGLLEMNCFMRRPLATQDVGLGL